MNATPDPLERELSRRRVFGILGVGAAGVAGLGACARAGDNGGNGNGNGGGGGGNNGDDDGLINTDRVFHGAWPFEMPPTGHFNLVAGLTNQIDLGQYRHLIYPPGALWYWADQEWLYLVAESFEFTENRFVYHVTPGLTWTDGSDLTSADVESTFWLRWLMNQQEWTMISGMESTDDLTVEFDLADPSTVLERRILQNAYILPYATYGEFADRARDLFNDGQDSESDDVNALREEVQDFRPENDQVITSGPFTYDFGAMSDSQLSLVKNADGVLADQVQFETIVLYNGETDDITPLVLDGTVDYATHGFPVSTQQQWESGGYRTLKPGVYSGLSLAFSRGRHPEFDDARFRQAIAHVINKEEAAAISLDESAQVPTSMAGFSELQVPDWVDAETLGELNPYEFDQDRAAELLEEAGWTQNDNGRWVTPEGDVASYDLTFQSNFADYPPSARYIADQLTEFGIEITLDGIESPNMTDRIREGSFDIATIGWGAGDTHPHFAFTADFVTNNYPIAEAHGGRGMDYDLEREVEGVGEVNIQRLITQSGEGLDEDRQRELVNQLALIFNIELPQVPIWERYGNNPGQEGVRVKEFPPDDDPIWQNAAYADNPVIVMLYEGRIEPA